MRHSIFKIFDFRTSVPCRCLNPPMNLKVKSKTGNLSCKPVAAQPFQIKLRGCPINHSLNQVQLVRPDLGLNH